VVGGGVGVCGVGWWGGGGGYVCVDADGSRYGREDTHLDTPDEEIQQMYVRFCARNQIQGSTPAPLVLSLSLSFLFTPQVVVYIYSIFLFSPYLAHPLARSATISRLLEMTGLFCRISSL